MERRDFLFTVAAAPPAVLGAGDKIRAAIIGAGGRGRYLTANFKELGVEMAGVCDVAENNLAAGLKAASSGAKPWDNYRRMLEDKSLDAVVIATPDHWHAQMTIDAVEAGKDVYVEKPMSHTIEDGYRVIEAVRRTKRVVQVGTQRRSFGLFLEAKKLVDGGALGTVRLVNSWWVNFMRDRKAGAPGKVDWNQWLGPAGRREVDPAIFVNWHYLLEFSGGMLTGQGAHMIDAINWFMGSTYPVAITCTGRKPDLKGHDAPDTATMCVEYPEYMAVFTLGYRAMTYNTTNDQMAQYHGWKARLDLGRESYALYPQTLERTLKASAERSEYGGFETAARSHIRNFMECIRSRKDPSAPVEAGHYTAVALSMASQAWIAGRRLRFDSVNRKAVG
jgi:predicted dehydrogenase